MATGGVIGDDFGTTSNRWQKGDTGKEHETIEPKSSWKALRQRTLVNDTNRLRAQGSMPGTSSLFLWEEATAAILYEIKP